MRNLKVKMRENEKEEVVWWCVRNGEWVRRYLKGGNSLTNATLFGQ